MKWTNSCRAFATIMVVLLHVSSPIVVGIPMGSLDWWFSNIITSIARWCVPVFVMLSGALLLQVRAEENFYDFYIKRIKKIFLPLIFWSLFYSLIRTFLQMEQVGFWSFEYLFKILFSGSAYYHLWYLYMIVFLYLFTPFLRKYFSCLNSHNSIFICLFIFLLVESASIILYFNHSCGLYFSTNFLLFSPYYMVGHVVSCGKIDYPSKVLVIFLIFLIVVLPLAVYFPCKLYKNNSGFYFYDYLSVLVVPMSIVIFLFFKKYGSLVSNNFFINIVSCNSFGVYLIHPFFIKIFLYFKIYKVTDSPFLSIPLVTFFVIFFSVCFSVLANRIKFVRFII